MAVAPTTSAPKATARDANLWLTWTFVMNPSHVSVQQEFLPDQLTSDTLSLERFRKEARAPQL